jgi:hypothetical protein
MGWKFPKNGDSGKKPPWSHDGTTPANTIGHMTANMSDSNPHDQYFIVDSNSDEAANGVQNLEPVMPFMRVLYTCGRS